MRIVGGRLAGRDLYSPRDRRVRPTAEPVRAAIMELVAAELPDARCLDLYAGTGALGLEAISRGARSCDFVEFRPTSLAALEGNVARLKLRERTRIFERDALRFAAMLTTPGRYDVCFVDPPYESRQLDRVVDHWLAQRFARVLVAEHAAGHALPAGGERTVLGETWVTVYRG